MKNPNSFTAISALLAVALASATPVSADYVMRQPITPNVAAAVPGAPTYLLAAFDQASAPLTTGYAFGNVAVAESRSGTIRVTNTGTGSVTLSSASLTGDAEFTQSGGANNCVAGMALMPGASCYAYPVFQPSAVAHYAATYNVAGSNGAAASVSISGSGAVGVALNAYDISGNPLTGAVSFGVVDAGQAYAGAGYAGYIVNTGSANAALSGVAVSGSPAFTAKAGGEANCAEATVLAAGATCNVYLSFAPATAGEHTASYRLNADTGQFATVGVSGTANPLQPTISALALPAGLDEDSAEFTIAAPTSSSTGAWTYTSSNPAVATVSGDIVTPVGVGSTVITASQSADATYSAGSVSATLDIAARPAQDPYWNSVTLGLHLDSEILDEKGHAVTASGVSMSGAQSKFGTASAYFDGQGGYLHTPYTSEFDWWTHDYTLEMWMFNLADKASNEGKPLQIGNRDPFSGADYWSFGTNQAGRPTLYYWNGSLNFVVGSAVIPRNTWTHLALVKQGSSIRFYVNGMLDTSVSVNGTPRSGGEFPLTIGRVGNAGYHGHLNDVRITKGQARYSGNFTPSAAPFPDR